MVEMPLKKNRGFSLLELGVIMFIVMILLGFSLPRFPQLFESDLQLETQKLAHLIDTLQQEAILKSENHKLIIDTQRSEYSVLTARSDQPETYSPHGQFGKPIPLKPPVVFVAVSSYEEPDTTRRFAGRKITFDKIFGQQFQVIIDSSGFVDPFSVRLKDPDRQLSLSVVNIMGKILIGDDAPL